MKDKNINNQDKPYIVSESVISLLFLNFLNLANKFLNFFSLKESKRFWGIVYDSVSKQPLDPVIVKLLYVDGREIETCITDINGRYGFLARPGKFKIYVKKTNYEFPSRYVTGDSDGVFENLYHGEFFTLDNEAEVVAPNIPMDPAGFDWNQKAKQVVVDTHPHLKYLVKKIIALIFWFLFILDIIYIWYAYPETPHSLYIIAAAFVLMLFFAAVIQETRLWGKLKVKRKGLDAEGLFLELHNTKFTQVSFGKAVVHQGGRFLLRANKGIYLLTISEIQKNGSKLLLGQTNVTVGKGGVLNSTILIK